MGIFLLCVMAHQKWAPGTPARYVRPPAVAVQKGHTEVVELLEIYLKPQMLWQLICENLLPLGPDWTPYTVLPHRLTGCCQLLNGLHRITGKAHGYRRGTVSVGRYEAFEMPLNLLLIRLFT